MSTGFFALKLFLKRIATLTNAAFANHAHADFAQPTEVRWIAHWLDPADVLAVATGEGGEFGDFSPRTAESAETGEGFTRHSRNLAPTLTVPV